MASEKPLRAVGLSGSPSNTSQSRALLDAALTELRASGASTDFVDLRRLDADALLARGQDPDVDAAIAVVRGADILAVSSPVYRATFSGLLKVFLDLLPPDALAGKVAIPLMTGGGPHHQLAVEHGLKPVLASVGAVLTATSVYGTTASFQQGTPNPDLKDRVRRAVGEAIALAGATSAHGTRQTATAQPN